MLRQEAAESRLSIGSGHWESPVSRALASLRVINGENVTVPSILIRHCAATLTVLNCYDLSDYAHEVLPCCTRLESLTLDDWRDCPPAAWLGLSQLHTLRGVSLSVVPAAAIAAALPRLHTLHLDHRDDRDESELVGFFDELLPRLRSFRLEGLWPEPSDETEMVNVPALPLLEDLKWYSWRVPLPRQLMRARPSTLDVTDMDLVAWLEAADGATADSPTATSPLACVQALTLRRGMMPPEATSMARLLRLAPRLRQFTFDARRCQHALWVLSDAFTPEPPFVGLVHPRLRHFVVINWERHVDVPVPRGCGARLRQRHFPRLRRLTVDDEDYPVCCIPRPPGRRKSF
jgi:hypothetical protein